MTAEQSTTAIQWYTGRNGAHAGPFSQAEIERQFRSGELNGTDFIWCQGWPEWKLVSSVLKSVEPTAPPPVAVAPTPAPVSKSQPVAVAPSPQPAAASSEPEVQADGDLDHESSEAQQPRSKRTWGVIAAGLVFCAAGAGWWALGGGGGSPRMAPKPVEISAKPAKPTPANVKPYTPEEAKAAADYEAAIEKEKARFAENKTIGLASLHIQYSMWLAEHGRYAEARAQSDLAMPVSQFHIIRNEALRRKAQAIALEAEHTPPEAREGLWRACVEAADGAINEGLTATQDSFEVSMLKGGIVVIARGIGNAYTLRGMCRVQLSEQEAGVADLKKSIEHLSAAPEEAEAIKRIEAIVQQLEAKPQ